MTNNTTTTDQDDPMTLRLRREALEALEEEPQLATLLNNTVLAPGVHTFEDAVACTITYRLLGMPCNSSIKSSQKPTMFCPHSLRGILADALKSTTILEQGHTMAEAVRLDAQSVCDRDPAVDSLLEVILFLKGFAALVCHRAAYYKWHSSKKRKSMVSLWLQSQASAVFGLDIHPAATMGAGILLDHGTGIVIGETATVGDGCTLLHGVTLGGTGKQSGDRHPKVGKDVLIGANASLLGNISIGNGAKIGAGSIVLGPIPSGATAVGAPAKIIGRAKEAKPASTMDETLQQVSHLHKSTSSSTVATTTSTTASMTDSSLTARDIVASNNGAIWDEDDSSKSNNSEEEEPNNNDDDKAHRKEPNPKTLQRQSTSSNQTNCCCPFRDYVLMAKSAPPGSITLCTLRHILKPEHCSVFDIGEVLFQLDTRNVGYVKPKVFFAPATKTIITEKTRLPPERVAQLLDDFHTQWETQNQALKDLKSTTKSLKETVVAPAPKSVTV